MTSQGLAPIPGVQFPRVGGVSAAPYLRLSRDPRHRPPRADSTRRPHDGCCGRGRHGANGDPASGAGSGTEFRRLPGRARRTAARPVGRRGSGAQGRHGDEPAPGRGRHGCPGPLGRGRRRHRGAEGRRTCGRCGPRGRAPRCGPACGGSGCGPARRSPEGRCPASGRSACGRAGRTTGRRRACSRAGCCPSGRGRAGGCRGGRSGACGGAAGRGAQAQQSRPPWATQRPPACGRRPTPVPGRRTRGSSRAGWRPPVSVLRSGRV